MGATIVIDAFWGDSGKGKISAHMTNKLNAKYAVRAGTGTNAGHSLFLDKDTVVKTNQIPLALVNKKVQLRVGSGVVVDPQKFFEEIKKFGVERRTKVDYRCAVILPEYKEMEAADSNLASKVGSTKSGTGYARAQFILRKAKQARDIDELKPYTADVAKEVNDACARGQDVVIEGSQGTYLSLALSPDYPFTTSDNCTAVASADDAGLSWQHIKDVVMVVKAVPSRVGEGPLPFEIAKEEIIRKNIAEYGVTTGRMRRKASKIDYGLLKYATMLNGPTQIALTFCDHYDPKITGATKESEITPKVQALIRKIEKATGVPVTMVETGKLLSEVIDLRRHHINTLRKVYK
ncbi:MAG: adenylosuccinate synthetase [archaeon]